MTPYRRKGRRIWEVKVPTPSGEWRQVSTRTFHAPRARKIQEMIDALGVKGEYAWDIFARVHEGSLTLSQLYDRWSECKHDLSALRRSLKDINLEPLVEEFLAAQTCTDDTKAHYRALLKHLIPPGKAFGVDRLTLASVQKVIDDVKGAAGTKRKAGAAIRSYCNWLVRRGVIATNPVSDARLPRPAAPRTLYLDTPDAIRLAEAQPSPYREFSALLNGSGIEVSVALKLRRRDVDVANKEIWAAGTKTHARARTVRVAEWAWPYVLQVIEGKLPDALLFAGIPHRWTAGDEHRKAIGRPASTGKEGTGLLKDFPIFKGYTMRDARHTFAVRAIRAGTPIDVVARQMGHATPTLVATVYGRFEPSQEERAKWEKIAAAMDAAKAAENSQLKLESK